MIRRTVWQFLAILATAGVVYAQTVPLGVTGSRNIGSGGDVLARIGPSGSIYIAANRGDYSFQAPTKSFGSTSNPVYNVAKVDASGNTVFTTALGGIDIANLNVDAAGNVYISGNASTTGFYTTPGAYLTVAPDASPYFVCKLSGTDGGIQYCTYLNPGTGIFSVTIDQAGDFIFTGSVARSGETVPTPPTGGFDFGSGNVYVGKINPAGSALTWASAFGGSGTDAVSSVETDATGNVWVTGQTTSGDFPTTAGAGISGSGQGGTIASTSFLAKVSADGTSLLYSTVGATGETPLALSIDGAGEPEVLYWSANSQVGMRRYSATGSMIVFDVFTGITTPDPLLLSGILLAIDAAGNTSGFLTVGNITAPLVSPTHTCLISSAVSNGIYFGYGINGFMIRLDPTGKIVQSTFLEGNDGAIVSDVSIQSGSITAAAWSGGELEVLTLGPAPQVNLACVGSSATLTPDAIAAGEIVSLFGAQIGPSVPLVGQPDANGRYPTNLGATQVTFDGVPAPLLYVSAQQINTVVPFAAKSTTHVCVTYFFNAMSCMDATVVPAAPGIFTIPGTYSDGAFYAAAVNQDGTINSASNPAPRGSIISLFATGLGPLSSNPADGTTVGLPLLTENIPVTVESTNPNFQATYYLSAAPQWAGQAPFEIAGLSQVNAIVPGYGKRIILQIGSTDTNVNSHPVQIWVK